MARSDEYKIVVVTPINGIDFYIDLDLCTARSLKSNARIAKFPVEDGVEIADHMYREARQLSLNGSFSLAGRATYENDTDTYSLSYFQQNNPEAWDAFFAGEGKELKEGLSSSDRLSRIQSLFEWIQARGVRCSIMMVNDSLGTIRFKRRDGMVLESISWTESYNSMQFSFTWTEVIVVGSMLDQFETFDFSTLYPQTSLPSCKSVGLVLQESGALTEQVVQALIENGYIAKADAAAFTLKGTVFEGYLSTVGTAFVSGIVSAAATILIGVSLTWSGIIAGTVAFSTVLSVAAPIGLAVGIIIGITIGIVKAVQEYKRRKRLQSGFNLVRNYEQVVDTKTLEPKKGVDIAKYNYNEQDISRLRILIEDITNYFNNNFGDRISIYQIESSNDNSSRDLVLLVGSDYLTIRIVNEQSDNTGVSLSFKMQLFEGTNTDGKSISTLFGQWSYATNFNQMNRGSNVIYISKDREYELYLYNPSLDTTTRQASQFTDECYNLSSYCFVVSKGNISSNVERMNKTILDALDKYGFGE